LFIDFIDIIRLPADDYVVCGGKTFKCDYAITEFFIQRLVIMLATGFDFIEKLIGHSVAPSFAKFRVFIR